MEHLQPPQRLLQPQSLPTKEEMSRYPTSTPPIDEHETENDPFAIEEDEWLLNGTHDSGHYGCSLPTETYISQNNARTRRVMGRRIRHKRSGSTDISISNLAQRFFSKHYDEDDDDDEPPPTIEMKYRRSKLDWIKLTLMPVIYILLMGAAIVFAFYTIQGLIESYSNKVRSVQQVNVGGRYPPIGIAVFPKFSNYNGCEYRYYDNLSPESHSPGESCSNYQIPFSTGCTVVNMTFNSSIIHDLKRSVLVFEGPTLVACKQSLKLSFGIDTSEREYSALEYILFDDLNSFMNKDLTEKQTFLAYIEQNRTVYTFPAGFRTWAQLSFAVYENFGAKKNYTEFSIIDSYAAYNVYNNTYMPMQIVFEWKTPHYDYVQEIVATTVWSAFGSFCGLLLTVVKVAEFCKAWIRRFRRDKEKKRLHLLKLEEEQKKLLESYETKKKEKEAKRKESLEATATIKIDRTINHGCT